MTMMTSLDGVERPMTEEEIAQYNADAAEFIANEMPIRKRIERDHLLSATDWWATSDRTMTAEQTAYRQALRDITTHANWPNLADSDWPTKPE